jgi:hypothetical protein
VLLLEPDPESRLDDVLESAAAVVGSPVALVVNVVVSPFPIVATPVPEPTPLVSNRLHAINAIGTTAAQTRATLAR